MFQYCIGKKSCTACTCQSCTCPPAPLLAGIIPTVVLILASIISVVVAVLITRYYYMKTSHDQKSCLPKGEDVYEQVEGPKTYEDIAMTDSPAYGPVK